ncbi:MAG TPA: hypothetical protein VLO00_07195, partial [Cryobacterium sp.]|nr:hypothetical protein [Cryobacterium sp.]
MLSIVISVLAAGAVAAGALTGGTARLVSGSVVEPTPIPTTGPSPQSSPEPSIGRTPTRVVPTGSPPPARVPAFDRSARSLDDPV